MKGDCLDLMSEVNDKSIDLVLVDPPYGTTVCKWDSVINLSDMWDSLKRIIKPSGAIVMTAANPFTSILVTSNLDMFKYTLVWEKSRVSHFAQAPYRFLTEHEDIVVFSNGGTSKNAKNRMVFNPQGLIDCNKICKGKAHSDHRPSNKTQKDYLQTKTGYPKSILKFASDKASLHPTQKPLSLMECLIKTYSNEGDTILDFAMGSGTTGAAAGNLNRSFIGMELDGKYFEIAKERIENSRGTKDD